ncbi:RagB/SusD family nutrient uptake outer membrane protein [Mucilaginibacter defluvii]|uniref:RagB/SusD family nutrient uptake outer membrane protein n=1 Tax=Mucilaginibacter defluvii TaxID=1196019 RepID=A0ABP9FN46_9SPHI|nr:RagB/SusD family nutrient uptake outer membrane protein [Bacteroidota bacterium]
MKNTIISGLLLFLVFAASCQKQDDWLDVKNNKSSVTPRDLQDLQAILDNTQVMNASCPILGLIGSDNVYFSEASVGAITAPNRNTYLWQKDIYQGANSPDWQNPYQQVEYSNIVLERSALLKPAAGEQTAFDNVRGSALFYRAFAFYQLSQLFAKPYSPGTAGTDAGIVVRLTADVNQRSVRSTVQEGYDQVIKDLKEATALLPAVPLYKTRPSQTAALALLAKVYLLMQNYQEAFRYADDALKTQGDLLDFKTLNITANQPFPSFAKGNPEIIFYASALGNSAVWPLSTHGRVNPSLYGQYTDNDLRKSAFYSLDSKTGLYRYKGSYEGSNFYNFTGFATNELYLIRAESALRNGNIITALDDLNRLLSKRYNATYVPVNTGQTAELLARIITERRKELPFTGNIRWEDLRRFNQRSETAVTIERNYKGQIYQLAPNSPLYTLPIPQNEIDASGIAQNPR